MNERLLAQARRARLLALDSDGVLTDGGVYLFEDGRQFRRFNIKDGLGLKRVMRAGLHVAIISASQVEAVRHRAVQLGIDELHLGVADKLAVLRQLCATHDLTLAEVAFMGDDLTDLPVLQQVGLPCAPADAVEAVRAAAALVTSSQGGHGAVREVCDLLVALQPTSAGDKPITLPGWITGA